MIAELLDVGLMGAAGGDASANSPDYGRLFFPIVGLLIILMGLRLNRSPHGARGRVYLVCGSVLLVFGLVYFALTLSFGP